MVTEVASERRRGDRTQYPARSRLESERKQLWTRGSGEEERESRDRAQAPQRMKSRLLRPQTCVIIKGYAVIGSGLEVVSVYGMSGMGSGDRRSAVGADGIRNWIDCRMSIDSD